MSTVSEVSRQKTINLLIPSYGKNDATIIEDSILVFTNEYITTNSLPFFLLQPVYDNKCSDMLSVILQKDIINSIKEKKIKINDIAYLKPDILNPKNYVRINERLQTEKNKEKLQTGSTAFKCPKCAGKNCEVTQKQTRSGDEPPTTIIECNICSHTFKIY